MIWFKNLIIATMLQVYLNEWGPSDMKNNVLIVGAGGVAHVTAHKCAMNNDVLGDICIASRKKEKCDKIIESIKKYFFIV